MLLDDLRTFVKENVSEHLQGLWTTDGESQLLFSTRDPLRIPYDGNGNPNFDDNTVDINGLQALGVSGWNWLDGRSIFTAIDLDGVNHAAGLEQNTLDDLVARLALIPEVEIIRSKSGNGYHARVYFGDTRPIAKTRAEHIAVGQRVLRWLAGKIGDDLVEKTDCCGVITWVYHADRKEHGFELLKPSTANMPDDWDQLIPSHVKTDGGEVHEAIPVSSNHKKISDALEQRKLGEWDGSFFRTHTAHLATIAEEQKITFTTLATGKDGPSARNCYMFPGAGGSWRVVRYHKGTKEHESWWLSANGWTTTIFNRPKDKIDPTAVITALAKDDELFHDANGRAFVSTTIKNVKETLSITDGRYRAKLRLGFTSKTGRIASAEQIKTAIAQLEAIALLERPEHQVAIRVAEHAGILYVDLADQERQVIEIDSHGWRLAKNVPVRFIRPFGMLPLPMPQHGGAIHDLQRFVNVDEADLPLLLAFIVGCFHPTGPYSLLQIVGEQGSAKSSLMRFISDLTDPQLATGNTLPRDERDLLVSAQQRWLLSFDNVDQLDRKLSSLLCMIVTGAASANRKLFTDSDQSILKAKRPVILTAIKNVVAASDLLDRTLTLLLPAIPADQRKSEYAIAEELRKDGIRGKILGYILNGVSSALAGHARINRDDMPRLADLFTWATAAERGLGLPDGSTIAAFKSQQSEESATVTESQLGRAITQLCQTKWTGTATELAAVVEFGSAKTVSNELREIAPDLRRAGYRIEFRRSNGKRIITLSV